jgi:hypothetical protein
MSTVGNTVTKGVAHDDPSFASMQVRGNVGFYGATPVAQRTYSSAVHATSALATSASFGATQLAAVQEIQNTLIGLGVWATA